MFRRISMFIVVIVLTALCNIVLYSNVMERIQTTIAYYAMEGGISQHPLLRNHKSSRRTRTRTAKFFMIPTPEITADLLLKENATSFYKSQLNEESAEVWLHRGFDRMDYRTTDPSEADVFVIAGYCHLAYLNIKARDYAIQLLDERRIYNKSKPHVVLCPSWNPTRSRKVGITHFLQQLQNLGVDIWSVGFERNSYWQQLNASRIIPIPYVVNPFLPKDELLRKTNSIRGNDDDDNSNTTQGTVQRSNDFVFYAGDARGNAVKWAGCNRSSLITPLQNETNMDVSIRDKANRLSQDMYNHRMLDSDYCLILCGDTVTSRSLASAIVYGCIPVRVGSRLRGLCESPCHKGWGWDVTGPNYPHLPFPADMDWHVYPELNEQDFSDAPLQTLQQMFQSVTPQAKMRIRENMRAHQLGWIYGWGDPVTSNDFGNATEYIWRSIVDAVGL